MAAMRLGVTAAAFKNAKWLTSNNIYAEVFDSGVGQIW